MIAGYDIRSEKGYEQMKAEFEQEVGRQYLKAVHLNDSKGEWIASIVLLFVDVLMNLFLSNQQSLLSGVDNHFIAGSELLLSVYHGILSPHKWRFFIL